ncbi:MAG: 3,4-dihydroxy-2-butanone-4-phosphate synthase, partial [Myxococcota bacterium]|nr:3,4-dihydroxy-2-butanone-4-phosphate synthase [Myxococcota bacterium]
MSAPTRLELKPNPDLHASIASVEAAVEDIRAGKMVILVDDEDRENEGDLCIAAEAVTP